jgi:maltokinase
LTVLAAVALLWIMTLAPADPGFLAPWMARQRWFANKGASPALEDIGRVELTSPEPGVRVGIHLLLDHAEGRPSLYQVPLTYRDAPLVGAEAAMVGMQGPVFVYDGPFDQAFTSALLDAVLHERELHGDDVWALGHHSSLIGDDHSVSRVLSGEQSNTSIIFEPVAGGTPVICKLFRALHHGDNPDVELQTALAMAGSEAVPRSVGDIVADWRDTGEASGRARGHLAFAQEFLPGVRDAWRVALDAARTGIDFTIDAHAMGVATAGVHATLAQALRTEPTTQTEVRTAVESMHGRLATALAEVPSLRPYEASIREVFALAAASPWPARQRIHGDLHLGQLLSSPGRGWMLVDFEGEPLRPMRERSQLDSPVRDVAGMLRSFDYVAGSLAMDDGVDAGGWAASARAAFERGYAAASGSDLRDHRAVLDAFELDKALYEAVYEVRNRPTWLPIPVGAIERLAARSPA